MKLYFTRDEILMGRDKLSPLTPEMEENLEKLIIAVSKVRAAYGRSLSVSSGYRPSSVNASVGGAKLSAHQSCQAVDIVDKDGEFAKWCLNNLTILEECNLFLESPDYTYTIDKLGNRVSGWVHLDIRGPKSGKRVFIPYVGGPKLKVVG